ncbi:MAG: response regulator [Planctomycetaceae bacterium]
MQILVVDDDELSLEVLTHALRKDGYEVAQAHNGDEALNFLSQGTCRLVISDWDMPGMSGLELCQAIRRRDFGGYIYVILLTNHRGTDDLVTGMSSGADEFLTKPFHPAELAVRLRAGRRIVSLETRDMAIFALAKLAESRDVETGQHLERVQRYSRALAARLAVSSKYAAEIDDEFIRLIFLTSPLHDIGKVGIPDAVLLKPGRLSPDEFEIMKSHTLLGAATLEASLKRFPDAKFLTFARDIAATHHERWDGTGYPNKLSGRDIPLCGRIVSLADVYDALSSRRVYKDAFTHVAARSIIVEGSGTHFDPDIVDAFLAIEDEFIEIRRCFAAEESVADITTTMPNAQASCEKSPPATTSC